MDSGSGNEAATPRPVASAVYFDGLSNRRHAVSLGFTDRLEILEDQRLLTAWSYADIRRADGPSGLLRAMSLAAPVLARLEIRDAAVAADLVSRCPGIDENLIGRRGVAAIIGWSIAAAVSIVVVVLFGVPLAADRLTPLVPLAFEQRLGKVADTQVKTVFDGRICDDGAGQAAF